MKRAGTARRDRMLEFGNDTYYSRMWFITGDKQDWLGALFRKGDGPWQVHYRFRYYAETGNDDDDRKSWYAVQPNETEAKCIAGLKVLIDVIQARFGGEVHELILCTDDPHKIHCALAREEWCHLTAIEAAGEV